MFRKQRKVIALMLAVLMAVSPCIVYAEPGKAKAAESERGEAEKTPAAKPSPVQIQIQSPKLALGYVTPNAMAAGVAFPQAMLTSPDAEMLPLEMISVAGKQGIGLEPIDIDQVMVLVEPPGEGEPGVVLMLHSCKPVDEAALFPELRKDTREDEFDGKVYRRGLSASIYCPDDRTILVGTDDLIRRMVENHKNPQEGELSKRLAAVETPSNISAMVLVEPIRPLLTVSFGMAPIPEPFADAKRLPALIQSISLKTNYMGDGAFSLTIHGNDEAAAKQIEKIVKKLIIAGRDELLKELEAKPDSGDPMEQAAKQYVQRISKRIMEWIRPVREGENLTFAFDGATQSHMSSIATTGILTSLLLPAVQAAREAARRAQSINNVKQILLAMLNYESANKKFPARASFSKDGKPLLSWRVHLLPFMEQTQLYLQFHLDEPWDSDHNKQLIPLMPACYQNPRVPAGAGMTNYLGVSGKDMFFDGDKALAIEDIKDGCSATVMVLEANADRTVPWTKPEDWEYKEADPLAGLGFMPQKSFAAGFVDGSVHTISNTIDPKIWRMLLEINDGNAVPVGAVE